MPRRAIAIIVSFSLSASLISLTGCVDYWKAQGNAAQSSAQARQIAAQAQRDNAQAAIIDAEARGVLAESQAEALTTSVDAVVRLSTVDDKYAMIFAGLLFLILGSVVAIVGLVIHRNYRPAPPPVVQQQLPKPLGVMIETPQGRMAIIQEPGETQAAFFMRVNHIKALTAGKDEISGYLTERR